jgi:hypothetical protein
MFEEPTPPLLAHWTWMMLNGTASTRMNLLEGAGGVSADGWTAEEMVRLRWSGACRWSQQPLPSLKTSLMVCNSKRF